MTALHRSPRQTLAVVFTAAMGLYSVAGHAQSSKAAEAAGATLFRDKGCAYCHGPQTQGTAKGPSLLNLRKTWSAEKIAGQIKNGGQKMPSFEDSLTPGELSQLVAYLRAKHRPEPAPLPPPAPTN